MKPKQTLVISDEAHQALKEAGMDDVYTNPLASAVLRWVLGLVITFLGTKVFKWEFTDAQMADYIEIGTVLIAAVAIWIHRKRSTRKIVSPADAAGLFLDVFRTTGSRIVKRDMLTALQASKPKVYEAVVELMEEVGDVMDLHLDETPASSPEPVKAVAVDGADTGPTPEQVLFHLQHLSPADRVLAREQLQQHSPELYAKGMTLNEALRAAALTKENPPAE